MSWEHRNEFCVHAVPSEERYLEQRIACMAKDTGPGGTCRTAVNGLYYAGLPFKVAFADGVPVAVFGPRRHISVCDLNGAVAAIVAETLPPHWRRPNDPDIPGPYSWARELNDARARYLELPGRMPMVKANLAATTAAKLGIKGNQTHVVERPERITVYVDAPEATPAALVGALAACREVIPLGTALTVVASQMGALRTLGAPFAPKPIKEVVAAALPFAPADLHRDGYVAALLSATEGDAMSSEINVFTILAINAALRATERALVDYQRRAGSTLRLRRPLPAGLATFIDAAVDGAITDPSSYWFVRRATSTYLHHVTR